MKNISHLLIIASWLIMGVLCSQKTFSQGSKNSRLTAFEVRGVIEQNGKSIPFGPWKNGWQACNHSVLFNLEHNEISITDISSGVVSHWYTIDSLSKSLSNNTNMMTFVCKDEKQKECIVTLSMGHPNKSIFASLIVGYLQDKVYFTYHLKQP
jgi:hypothetical protein